MSDNGPEVDSGFPKCYASAWSEADDKKEVIDWGVWRVGSGLSALAGHGRVQIQFQPRQGSSQPSVAPVLGDPALTSVDTRHTHGAHIHAGKTLTHRIK